MSADLIYMAGIFLIIVCCMTILAAGGVMIRRKVRREIGYWSAHMKYRPRRPQAHYHFGDYGEPQIEGEEEG